MTSLKIQICAAAVAMGLSAFINASAGTIGGTNTDWNNWQEVAGLPAARYDLAAGVLNGALYAVGGHDGGVAQTNVYRFNGTDWTEVAGLLFGNGKGEAPRSAGQASLPSASHGYQAV